MKRAPAIQDLERPIMKLIITLVPIMLFITSINAMDGDSDYESALKQIEIEKTQEKKERQSLSGKLINVPL